MSGGIRLRPTQLGGKAIGFFAVLLATFFAIPYSNLFFLGLAFLAATAAAEALAAWRNLRGVDAALAELPPSPAGAPIPFRFVVQGGSRPRAVLCGVVTAGDRAAHTAAGDVRGDATLLGELPALARGVYPIACAAVESHHPHGLLRARRGAAAPRELVIYPAPAPLRRGGTGDRSLAAAAGAGASRTTVGLRDWRTGDDPRGVHWKASARRGQLVVRETDAEHGEGLTVVLDRRCPPAKLEPALSTLAALALHAEQRKERLTLCSQGLAATYGGDRMPIADLLRALATLQALPADAAPPPPAPAGALLLPEPGAR